MTKAAARLAVFTAVAALASACAPIVGSHGFQTVDVAPAEIKVGEDTKSTVLAQLGSPSATSTFEDNIWYYISQTTERYTYNRPQVSQRSVTAITFAADDKVTEVRTLGLEDGQQVAMNDRETPTRGRELTVIEQLLGNVGRGQLPRTDEDVPGQRRPD
jgi:outer membrane protein assembly factor BamE (lipoprotein component of BamABCDE complex)